MTEPRELAVSQSAGNVFEDIELPDAVGRLAKAELARQIGAAIRERGLTQTAAATALGIDQPKVSALLNGRLAGFSIERLMHFLDLLGKEVQIVVSDRASW